MSYRASPPRKIPAFTKTAVDDNEVFGDEFTAADFVNLEASYMTHEGGFSHPVYALMPDKHQYDRIRFSFGPVTEAGTVTTASVQVWVIGSDGAPSLVGQSDLSAAGTFEAIEFENFQGTYYVAVAGLTGSEPVVSFDTFIQGVYQGYVV